MLEKSGLLESPWVRFDRNERSDTLLIIFSQVSVPFGKFGLSRIFSSFSCNKLFINTSNDDWYVNGIGGIGDVAYSCSIIDNFIQQHEFKFIVTFGVSMGAFGAALYGALLEADMSVCFGCETKLYLPLSKSLGHNKNTKPNLYSDLRPFLNDKKTIFYFVAGGQDIVDCVSAKYISDSENVNIFVVKETGHTVTSWMQAKGKLVSFLDSLINGKRFHTYDFFESDKKYLEDCDAAYALLCEANTFNGQRDFYQAIKVTENALAFLPCSPLILRMLAKLYAKVGEPETAIDYIRRALSLSSDEGKLWYEQALYLQQYKKKDEALASIEKAIALSPHKWSFYLRKLEILFRFGAQAEALQFLDMHTAIFSTDKSKQELSSTLKKFAHK